MSNGSSNSRIDWRPSRLYCVALACLGALAAISVGLSAMPAWASLPLAALALARGLWLAASEWRRRPCQLELRADDTVLMRMDASELALGPARLSLRGVVTTLAWREAGRRQSLAWCMDTLAPAARRQLRLRFATGPVA